jgi:hypothetical protein
MMRHADSSSMFAFVSRGSLFVSRYSPDDLNRKLRLDAQLHQETTWDWFIASPGLSDNLQAVSLLMHTQNMINPDMSHIARTELSIPFRLLLLLFAWPVIPWMRRRRRSAPAGNCCAHCGYDLRATPDRCPECGTIPANLGRIGETDISLSDQSASK